MTEFNNILKTIKYNCSKNIKILLANNAIINVLIIVFLIINQINLNPKIILIFIITKFLNKASYLFKNSRVFNSKIILVRQTTLS